MPTISPMGFAFRPACCPLMNRCIPNGTAPGATPIPWCWPATAAWVSPARPTGMTTGTSPTATRVCWSPPPIYWTLWRCALAIWIWGTATSATRSTCGRWKASIASMTAPASGSTNTWCATRKTRNTPAWAAITPAATIQGPTCKRTQPPGASPPTPSIWTARPTWPRKASIAMPVPLS